MIYQKLNSTFVEMSFFVFICIFFYISCLLLSCQSNLRQKIHIIHIAFMHMLCYNYRDSIEQINQNQWLNTTYKN